MCEILKLYYTLNYVKFLSKEIINVQFPVSLEVVSIKKVMCSSITLHYNHFITPDKVEADRGRISIKVNCLLYFPYSLQKRETSSFKQIKVLNNSYNCIKTDLLSSSKWKYIQK